jgi:hypothetical protein
MYGRSDDEWDRIVDDAVDFLADQARLGRVVSYSDLNSALARRGHVPFDFAIESVRNAVGAILGDATQRTLGESKTMLSAIDAETSGADIREIVRRTFHLSGSGSAAAHPAAVQRLMIVTIQPRSTVRRFGLCCRSAM